MLFSHTLVPELVLLAYRQGYFPMSEEKDGPIFWHRPQNRAVIPLGERKRPKSLRQSIRKHNFEFRINTQFRHVITKCADREETRV